MAKKQTSGVSESSEQLKLYRDLVETSQDLVWQCDVEGRYSYLNPAWETTFGYKVEEMLGKKSSDFQTPEMAKRDIEEFKRLMHGNMVKGLETVHRGKAGNAIHLVFNVKFIRNDYGEIIGTSGTAHDITERKRIEAALQQSVEKYRSIVVSSPMGIHLYEVGTDGGLIFTGANPAANKILGVDNAIFIGKTIEEAFPPLAATEIPDRYREVAKTGKTWQTEQINYRDDKIQGAFHVVAFRTSDNCMAAMFLDITERKRGEETIAAEKERLAVTLRSIGDGVITVDTQGNVVTMNKVAEELCGWKFAEAQGKPLTSVFTIMSETTHKPRENPVEKVLASGEIIELANHTLLIARDGAERIIADSSAPIKDKDGKTIGVVLVFRDMTEKQKINDAMQRAQKLESLGVLAGGIAHDFNNLMAGIFGFIDLANVEPDKRIASSYLSKAMNTIDRARALTGQLLTFAKGGAPIRKTGDLFPFVKETAQFALSGSNVSCHFDVPHDLWPCNFDKNQIGQVIDNLIINAQQAMPVGGTIELIARNSALADKEHPSMAKGNYVKISVKDCGIGIPKELIAKIFDPFFTTKAKGHGLGLATCYSIVKKHEGCIDVDSEMGKGSTFHIYLPAATDSVAATTGTPVPMRPQGSGTFLIMDDEVVVRETISAMLKSLGYTVECKENGEEAVAFFASETTANREIVGMIFDLTVPGGRGGKAAVEEIRKLNREIPVFVASGYAEDPVIKNPQEYGFTASICKPFRIAELAEMLNKYMKPNN